MALYSYSIAVGSDQSVLTNFEDIFLNLGGANAIAPYRGDFLIPLGSVRRTTLDNRVVTNGTKIIRLTIAAASWDDFERYVLAIHGDWETESVDVTLDVLGRDNIYHRGNTVAILPLAGEDYQRREHGAVEDLVLTYRNWQEVSDSAFSLGFSLGFEA